GVAQPPQLRDRRSIDEARRVAQGHAGLRDGLEDEVGVGERGRQHRLPGLGSRAEGAGQGLLDNDVLAGLRRRDSDEVMAVGRGAVIDHVHVGRGDERPVVGEHTRDRVAPGEFLGLAARAGADRRELDPGPAERPVVRRVKLRREPRADDPDAQGAHARRVLTQSLTRCRGERTSYGNRWRYFWGNGASAEWRRARSARWSPGSSAKPRVRVLPPWCQNGAWTIRRRRPRSATASDRSRSIP